jgi:N4-(beta-N-acetylglucosaminyl)-L-asparaginase
MLTRRTWIHSALTAGVASAAVPAPPRNIVIASSNGSDCCRKAREMLDAGADTLDAVIAGVNIQELDPEDTSVGYGGLPNEDGVVELDACVMHGPSRRAGSVASIQGIKTPSKVAKLVMERSDHVMIVGDGALRFARAHGFDAEDLLTDKSRLAWLIWKESLGSDWGPGLDTPPGQDGGAHRLERFPQARPEWLAWTREVAENPPTGTINCLGLNTKGEISGCTTTSGLAWKIPGRVGDSPIIGAGLYVDQDIGGAGSTGRGEEAIRVAGAHTVVENMRHGMSPKEACLDALKRVSRNYDDNLERLQDFQLRFYGLRKDGEYSSASLWSDRTADGGFSGSKFTVNDGGASRIEEAAFLYERPA